MRFPSPLAAIALVALIAPAATLRAQEPAVRTPAAPSLAVDSSRADSVRSKIASCAGAVLTAHARRQALQALA